MRRLAGLLLLLTIGLCADRAESASAGIKSRATFAAASHSTDQIASCSIGASPWSPRANVLALATSRGLALLDMDTVPPRQRLLCTRAAATQYKIAWAADGQRMACLAHLVGSFPVRPGAPDDSLFVIDIASGARHFVHAGWVWPFFWASDGGLYGWTSPQENDAPVQLLAPAARSTSSHLGEQTLITQATRPLVRFTPGNPPTVQAVEGFDNLFQRSGFPDGKRYLISRLASDPMERNLVLDASGRILKHLDGRFRDPRGGRPLRYFSACSVTSDGLYVGGFCEIDTPDGENIARAPVFLVAMQGDARLPLVGAPDATKVEFAIAGGWVALQSLNDGLYVGRWRLTH
jgi:hypothetical protein